MHLIERRKCLRGRYSCTRKRDGRHKARIVAQDLKSFGRAEAKDVYAATPAFMSIRLLLAAAPCHTHNIHTTDFDTAYLQGSAHPNGKRVLFKLWDGATKSFTLYWLTGYIYGEQPAGRNWKDTLSGTLENDMDFTEAKNAPSMYYRESDGTRLSVFVDDPLVTTKKPSLGETDVKDKFYQDLKQRFDIKDIKTLGGDQVIDYLSMRISTDASGETTVCNPEFIDQMVRKAGLEGCNPVKNAITKDLLKEIASEVELEMFVGPEEITKFQSTMGDINWLAQTTHPDVAVAVSQLAKRCVKPTPACLKAAKHVIRYLSGRRAYGFKYGTGDGSGLVVWTDSDCAGTHAIDGEQRSRMGITVRYNGFIVGWITKLIPGIMVSSGEAEIYALSEAIRIALHMKYVGEELGIEVPDEVPIMCDAKVAIAFAENTIGVGRMKHLDLRAGWIRQMKDGKGVKLIKVPGPENDSDFFTKILPQCEFRKKVDSMVQRIDEVGEAMVSEPARGHGDIQNSDGSARVTAKYQKRADASSEDAEGCAVVGYGEARLFGGSVNADMMRNAQK